MGDISDKAGVGQNIPREAVSQLAAALLDPAASPAHEVDMVGVVGEVVGGGPVVQVGVADDAERLERLQRAVDGGGRECATTVNPHVLDHRVWRRMAQRRHGVEDALALRGHPPPVSTQLVAYVLHPSTVRSERRRSGFGRFGQDHPRGLPTLCGC